jgi:hypothetical protein
VVIAYQYAEASPFSEDVAAVKNTDNDLWGFIDKTGTMVIPEKYENAGSFGEGLAWVQEGEGSPLRFIDHGGNVQFTFQCATARTYHEGLCAVAQQGEDGKLAWGFLDKAGKLAIGYQFDDVSPFKNGIAQVILDEKIGYIRKDGSSLWKP